jgi:hypothetical protein
MTNLIDFTRIKRLLDARNIGPEESAKVEQAIAEELINPKVLAHDPITRSTAHNVHSQLRPFEAAEELSAALDVSLIGKVKGKYDPKYANARTMEDVWTLRQAIDSLGMPYTTFIGNALQYLGKPNGRTPRLSQLMHRDVVTHVANEWVRKLQVEQ